MRARTLLYAFLIWIVFGAAESLGKWAKNSLLSPNLGEYPGHVISTILLICFVLAITYAFMRYSNVRRFSSTDFLFIGVLWVVLTIGQEFVLGHYYRYRPWAWLLADYRVSRGRLKGLVLLSELVAPFAFGTILLKSRKGHRRHRSRTSLRSDSQG